MVNIFNTFYCVLCGDFGVLSDFNFKEIHENFLYFEIDVEFCVG